ncbi:MAG: hypothetical protein ACRD82_04755 [Blastocatellia bacterium]
MHETMLIVSYESLGKILQQIRESADAKNSRELAERVDQAISFHQQMDTEVAALQREHQHLKQKLSDMTRESGERICYEPATDQFAKYEAMKSRGATPQEVYSAVKNDGLTQIHAIAALRRVFNLHVNDAQDVLLQVEAQFHQRAA